MRGCSCRGTAGVVHLSCLVEQAKILVAEAEENNLDYNAKNARWDRWQSCHLCKQRFHGKVRLAMGCACWKTYVGRPEGDQARLSAMTQLGNSLASSKFVRLALTVYEAHLSACGRILPNQDSTATLTTKGNMVACLMALGRLSDAVRLAGDVYGKRVATQGEAHPEAIREGMNMAAAMIGMPQGATVHERVHIREAKKFLLEQLPLAQRVLGAEDRVTLGIRREYARALYVDEKASPDELRESEEILDDLCRTSRRVLGPIHDQTHLALEELVRARKRRAEVRAGEA